MFHRLFRIVHGSNGIDDALLILHDGFEESNDLVQFASVISHVSHRINCDVKGAWLAQLEGEATTGHAIHGSVES